MTPPAPQSLTILTGASRGMGAAMARQLLAPGHTLLTLARHPDAALANQARDAGATLTQWPVDLADATAILKRLSGKTHRVLTGVAINHMGRTEYVLSVSEVRFRTIDDEEIRHYVMSGEPMDKAGAYGIQGLAGLFVEHLAGSYTGVMGLPVCETGELLKSLGFRPL